MKEIIEIPRMVIQVAVKMMISSMEVRLMMIHKTVMRILTADRLAHGCNIQFVRQMMKQ